MATVKDRGERRTGVRRPSAAARRARCRFSAPQHLRADHRRRKGETLAAASRREKRPAAASRPAPMSEPLAAGSMVAERRSARARYRGDLRPLRLSAARARQGTADAAREGGLKFSGDTGVVKRATEHEWNILMARERAGSSELSTSLFTSIAAKVVKGGRGPFAALVIGDEGPGRVRPRQGARGAGKRSASSDRSQAQPHLVQPAKAARQTTWLGAMAPARCFCARPSGTGIIVYGPMRAVFETPACRTCAKSMIVQPLNMVRATSCARAGSPIARSRPAQHRCRPAGARREGDTEQVAD